MDYQKVFVVSSLRTYRPVKTSGNYILADAVSKFEKEFAAYCNVRNIIGVGNGLDALTLIIKGYADWKGSESFNMKLSERRAKKVESYLKRLVGSIRRISTSRQNGLATRN